MTDYANFRQRLDAVLHTLDVNKVQDFLIAEGQWSPGTPANPEFAMWMMIAGSSTLNDLHEQAQRWLESHGHGTEAQVVLGRSQKQRNKARSRKPQTHTAKGGGESKRSRSGKK